MAGWLALGVAAWVQAATREQAAPVRDAATALRLRCHIVAAGYRTRAPDGRALLNADSPLMPPGEEALVIVDRATGEVRIAGGSLPHTEALPGRATFGGGDVRFAWGGVAYDIGPPDPAGSAALRFNARTVIEGGSNAGNTMESFGVGACTPAQPP